MTKELLKQLHQDTWLIECLDHLEEEFFNPDKEIRFLGENRYYDLRPYVAPKQVSLVERVMTERIYQQEVWKRKPQNDNEKIWNEEALKTSREIEERLIRKMTARNSAVGDVDKAKQYPINELLKFVGGFAKCLEHQERTGSLKYYKESNTCYCFSCAKSFDSIDIYKLINNCSFKEAVIELSK
jgi:hypothetical protein